MNFSLEEAYAEACKALGEKVVEARLVASRLSVLPPATPIDDHEEVVD